MSPSRERHGETYQEVEPKRSWDKIPVNFDWHDYLASKRASGINVTVNTCIRLVRAQSRGLQFRCTVDGVTGKREPVWPQISGATVQDGSVLWQAEPITSESLRANIESSDFPSVDGLTLSDPANNDFVYGVFVAGGYDGQDYEVRHQVVLTNGEEKEGVAVLSVRD